MHGWLYAVALRGILGSDRRAHTHHCSLSFDCGAVDGAVTDRGAAELNGEGLQEGVAHLGRKRGGDFQDVGELGVAETEHERCPILTATPRW